MSDAPLAGLQKERKRALRIVLLTLCSALAACTAATRTTGAVAVVAAPTVSGPSVSWDPGFTNHVSETPWWQTGTSPSPSPPPSPSPAATSPPVTRIWTLSGDVLFDTGSAELSLAARSQLDGMISDVCAHAGAQVQVGGHTDSVPAPEFPGDNQGLSDARAAAVASLILSRCPRGFVKVDSRGYGATVPVGDDATQEGRRANRRVEVTARMTSA